MSKNEIIIYNKPKEVDLSGYFCISTTYPDIDRPFFLPRDLFKPTTKRFKLEYLSIMRDDKDITYGLATYGTFFNQMTVRGVIDMRDKVGSPIPFFIDERKTETLQKLIEESIDTPVKKL